MHQIVIGTKCVNLLLYFYLIKPMTLASCSVNCFKIKTVKTYECLRISLDINLKFDEDVRDLAKYLCNSARQLWHLTLYCSPSLTKIVYNGMVKSEIEYGSACWGETYFNIVNAVIIKQKRAVRIVCRHDRLAQL